MTCSSDNLTLPNEGLPAALALVSGNAQSATVAAPLPDSLLVRVTDSKARPVEGIKVVFTPTLGGGDAVPDTGVTNADGRTGSRWLLGSTAGAQRMQAMVVGPTSGGALAVNFDATAVAAVADTVFAVRGNNQSAEVGAVLPDSLVVKITDRFGNAVSGAAVTWGATGGGAVNPASSTTGTAGTAATRRTLGPAAGPQGATATAAGLRGSPVTFAMTAQPAAPTSLVKVSGDNQVGVVSGPLTDSLVVQLLDGDGNGVPGRNVTFAVATGGGATAPTSATTDTGGRAATKWTLGPVAGGNSLIATSSGFSVTFQATGNSSTATTLLANAPLNRAGTAGLPVASLPSVRVTDANSNPVAGVAVSFTVSSGGGSVLPVTPVLTNEAGIATANSWVLGTTAGANSVTAAASGLTPASIVFTADGAAGAPTQLAFSQGPSNVTAGAAIAPAVTVAIRDGFGNLVTTANTSVTLALGANPGGSTLGGTKTVAASGGTATFSTLTLNKAAVGYTLAATATGLSGATSGTFTVSPASASALAFVQQPTAAAAGAVLTPAVSVAVQDAFGNTVTGSSAPVTVALGANPSGATLGGTLTQAAVSGIATFPNLTVNRTGSNYTLTAGSASLAGATSSPFSIGSGTASRLVFTGQPSNAVAGTAIAPPVQVTVQDALGNTVTGASTSITVAIGTNPAGGSLSGTKVVSAVSGVATFSTLAIDKAGTGYTLTANGGGLPQATSAAFNIQVGSGNKLVFITQPSNTTVGAAIAPPVQVAIQDGLGNTIGTATDSVQLSLFPSGALGGTVGVRAAAGIATFSNVSVPNAGTGYSLTAFAPVAVPALSAGTSSSFDVSAATTATTITSDTPDPTVTGQPYTVAFSVTSPGGTPAGNVTVTDGTDTCSVFANGTGSCSLTSTRAGNKNLVATYTATSSFGGSASAAAPHTVNKAATVLLVSGDGPDPSVTGQGISVTWNSFVPSPGGGTPTGNVTVSDGTGATCVAPVAAGSCVLTPTTIGSKTLTVTYAGDANFNGASDTEPHTVNKAATTTTIGVVSPNPASFGQVVTVNFGVVAAAPGSGTPTGSVTVSDGANGCSATVAAGSCSYTPASQGSKTLTATYAGDGNYVTSASAGIALTVTGAATTTAISAHTPNPVALGSAIAVTVTVTSATGAIPTGSVLVSDDLGATCSIASLTAGAGSCTLTPTGAGTRTLTAAYTAANSNFTSSSVTGVTHTVNVAPTSTALISSLNPSSFGASVTFTATVTTGVGSPTGTVQFKDGAANLGSPVALVGGVATFPTSALSAASHPITAVYGGDANHATSTSGIVNQVVNQAATATALASSLNPATYGQVVTFTATVTSGAGTPTGTIQFRDGATNLGTPVTLVAGVATYPTSTLTVASHPITAVYSGDANFGASSSSVVNQVVNLAASATGLTSSVNPSTFGQSVTFTATVTSGVGTPTGTIQFKDGAVNLGTPVALNGSGVATLATAALGIASHPITAVYSGDATRGTSTSGTVTQVVNQAASTSGLTSSLNPSTFGQPVTFTATVTGPGGTPSGTVQFKDGAGNLGAAVPLNGSGVATYVSSALSVASHPITAVYSGDATYNGSTSSTVNQVVNQATTATALGSSANPSTFGQSVTFTASVTSGAGIPTGTVQFKDGAANLGSPVPLNGSGVATYVASALSVASHPITAVYSGDGTYGTSTSSAVNQVVNPAATATALGSSANPSTFGQSVTFTATVTGPGGTPTGTVQFKDGAGNLGAAVPLNGSGIAIYVTTALSVASHPITAVYGGDASYATSTSATVNQVVNQAASATGLTSSLNPSTFGASVTFTATVTGPGGTPTGTVQFKDGAANLGAPVSLNGSGVATYVTTALSVASHPITAVYSGDASYATSTSSTVNQVVNLAASATGLTSSLNPSTFGTSVTFTATVTGPGGTPTGTVQFRDGATNLGAAVPLNGSGVATYVTSALSAASHPITAVYSGDATYGTSTSSTVNQVVTTAASTTVIASSPNPSSFGQSVTFTATVTGPGGTPTGTVQFREGSTDLGAPVALTAGVATYVTTTLSVGNHPVRAIYSGDANYGGSSSGSGGQTVNQAASGTALGSSFNPSTSGAPVTFTATVTGPGSPPTGTVQFKDGAANLGAAVPLNGSGVATLATSSLSVASHPITAVYSGDVSYTTSTSSTLNQVVNLAPTSTALASSANPSTFGQSVTFTATVTSGIGIPTGTVQFKDGAANLGSPVALNGSGVATYLTSALSVASHPITAVYSGDATRATGTSNTVSQVVNLAATTTAITGDTPDPTVVGEPFTVTFAVTGPGGTPTGNVTVSDGVDSCVGTVAAGTCSLSLTTVGARTLGATYAGDASYQGGSSAGVAHQVNQATTTTSITSHLPDPSTTAVPVTVAWSVLPTAPGSGTPTGTVTVTTDGAETCSAAVAAGSCALTFTSAGAHTLTATYGGDVRFTGSASAVTAHTVN